MAWDIGASGTFSAVADDAQGNQVKVPIAFTTDDPTILAVTDNNDGTCSAVAVAAGTTNLTGTATNPDGTTAVGTFPITVNPAATPDATSVTITETSGPDVTPAGAAAPVAAAVAPVNDAGPVPTPVSADSLPNNG